MYPNFDLKVINFLFSIITRKMKFLLFFDDKKKYDVVSGRFITNFSFLSTSDNSVDI